jgi:hypothetical protein
VKRALKRVGIGLGTVAMMTACGGGNGGDDTPPAPTPVEQAGVDNVGICTGIQVSADHERVQIKVNCQDLDGIDLYGETGHPAPYIDVQGFQQALSSIPEEHITRNADGIVIAVVDWQVMGYFSSNYRTTGKVVMWSVDGESGEYKEVESVPFAVQTAQAPVKPTPTPTTNKPPKWTASSYNTGLTIEDGTDAVQNIKNLKSVSSDPEGDTITYSIVSVSSPDSAENSVWSASLSISSGSLVVKNLKSNDPDSIGVVNVTIRATAKGGSANTTIKFNFNDVQ